MFAHNPKALSCPAAALRAVMIASVSLLALSVPATSGLAQDRQPVSQPRTEVAPFQHGLHAVPAGMPTPYDEASPPAFDNLGTHGWTIDTKNPEAQAFFDQGLRLAYGFNHGEARRAFRQAQRLDPTCTMCFWAEAWVLGPNINVPMDSAANAPALAALERAQALAGQANEKEQALIAALAKRYSADPKVERASLDNAWADALGEVAKRFPDDIELAVLHAEAMMDTQPWDYWTDGGKQPKGQAAEIVSALERAMAKNPEHPGAIHLYIHAVEASDRPERAEPGADRLAALIPGAGHVVHMPSHIYYRVGRYADALAANKAAVGVDEAYIAAVHPSGPYPLAYYPHNLHFLMAAAQAAGDSKTALEAASKLERVVTAETALAVPMVQPDMAAPYWAQALFGTPEAVLALGVPDNAPTYTKAMRHYARGAVLAFMGRTEETAKEIDAIQALEGQQDLAKAVSAGIPGPEVLNIAREVLTGRIAQAKGDSAGAIAAFQRAAVLQEGLAYMEPPYWYYPVRQSLGAALLRAGRLDEAEEAFRAALVRAPNNGWALFGLMETAKARGDAAAAQDAEARLGKTWVGDRSLLMLNRL
jgi:tetratricopeptide (TPR) repeat protein